MINKEGQELNFLLVGSSNGVIHVLDLLDSLDGSKDLFSADLHVIGDITKDRGLNKETLVPVASPSGEKLCPLLLARVNIAEDLPTKKHVHSLNRAL